MKLVDAFNLLVEDGITDNHRYFAEVYKLFQFKDEDDLKAYLEFIVHEPVHWMRGFPVKLTTKTSYSKPKTAIIKLLKKEAVVQDLGQEFVDRVYDCVWNTYKKEHVTILAEREKKPQPRMTVIDHFDTDADECLPVPPIRNQTKISSSNITHITEEESLSGIESLHETEHEEAYEESISHVGSSEKTDKERVEILKAVLLKMATTLPDGISDAFQILVKNV